MSSAPASRIKPLEPHRPESAAEMRAIVEQRRPYCNAIFGAMMRGDHDACAAAQRAMREAFPEG